MNVPSTEPAGTILGSDPAAGTSHPPGTSVDVLVSDGSVRLPSVVGMEQGPAVARLVGLGLDTKIERVDAGNADEVGQVLSMSPGAGTLVPPGSTVTLTVGRSPDGDGR